MPTTEDHGEPAFWVVCLCAQWCGVCREWQPHFEELSRAHPQLAFAWVDVEDEADVMGEVDIETFPTLLVARGGEPLFFGPIPPSGAGLARLVDVLLAQPGPGPGLDDAAGPLLRRLHDRVLRRTRV